LLFGRTLTSLPFVNFGGVLTDADDVAQALMDEAARLAASRRCKHVELRHLGRRFPQLPCKQHKVTMRLPLEAGMWDRIDRKARNQVRKAEKSDLTVVRGHQELLPEFYQVFARNMRDLGTPVYASRFFAEVLSGVSGSHPPDRGSLEGQAGGRGIHVPDRIYDRDSVGVVHPRFQQPLSESPALLACD
jgi:hypothetical protein